MVPGRQADLQFAWPGFVLPNSRMVHFGPASSQSYKVRWVLLWLYTGAVFYLLQPPEPRRRFRSIHMAADDADDDTEAIFCGEINEMAREIIKRSSEKAQNKSFGQIRKDFLAKLMPGGEKKGRQRRF